jgi:hypothetical protein
LPVWSADGSRLAFVREEIPGDDLRTTIEIADSDGANVRTVVTALASTTEEVVETPAWSPDGNRLLYTRTNISENDDVRVVHSIVLDGSDDRVLMRDGGAAEWSPDGKRLVYADYRDQHGETCGENVCSANGEIAIVNADGTGRRLLTSNEADDERPHWSPDGTRILFSSGRNVPMFPTPELYSIAPDGSCLTWLTNGTPESRAGDWGPGPGSADPGKCGDAGRGPLVEVKPGKALRHAIWLGPRSGDTLLDQARGAGRNAHFDYMDCGAFQGKRCQPFFLLEEHDTCARSQRDFLRDLVELMRSRSGDVRRVRGGALAVTGLDGSLGGVFTGRSLINFHNQGPTSFRPKDADAENARANEQIIADLRPVTRRRKARLRSPVLPRELLKRVPPRFRRGMSACPAGAR